MSEPTNTPTAQTPVPKNFYRGARFTWHQRRRHALVRRLMKGLEGQRVLDYGCGYGDLTYALSKTNPVVGIDVDQERIEFCRSQYPELEFHEFDGMTAPFPDGSFDVVLSCVVLPFVPDYRAHIDDLRRLLGRQGRLRLATSNFPLVRSWARRLTGRGEIRNQLAIHRPHRLRVELESMGFVVERSDYFYDPPFVDWRSLQDVAIGTANQFLSLMRFANAAHYFAIGARKSCQLDNVDAAASRDVAGV